MHFSRYFNDDLKHCADLARKDISLRCLVLRLGIAATLTILVCFPVPAQNAETDLYLWDSAEEPGCEHLLNRLDVLSVEVQKHPGAKGFVIVYGSKGIVKHYVYETNIKNYGGRRWNWKDVSVIPVAGTESLKLEFWISRSGKSAPRVESAPFNLELPLGVTRAPFVRDIVEVVRIDGRWTYFGDCSACCVETIDIALLAEVLRINPPFRAVVDVYAPQRTVARRIVSLLRAEAVENGITSSKFRIRVKPRHSGSEHLSAGMAAVDINLVK